MKVFKEQLNDLLTFWECELDDRKSECSRSENVEECENIIEIINRFIEELEEEKIQKVKDFCYRYLSLNLDDFDSRKLLEKILEILGD